MHKQMILPKDLVCEKILLHEPAAVYGWEEFSGYTGHEINKKHKKNE